MGSEIGNVYFSAFIYYILILNATLLFFSRPSFLKRFNFNFGTVKIRAALAVLLFISSILLGSITYLLRVFNGMIIF